jgi:phage repressor protein C with HTH and peptisase S24 domain
MASKNLTHYSVWRAIDLLAAKHRMSISGLARRAGLDPTTFNPSKRHLPNGKPRWPSTETIAKILAVTDQSLADFASLTRRPNKSRKPRRRVRA